jgi:hypothetical protein
MATQEHLEIIFVIERNLEKKLWQNIFFPYNVSLFFMFHTIFSQGMNKRVHLLLCIGTHYNNNQLASYGKCPSRSLERKWECMKHDMAKCCINYQVMVSLNMKMTFLVKKHYTKFYNFTNSSTWRKARVCCHTLLVDP